MRIVCIDDQLLFRELLCRACQDFGHDVVGEAGDGVSAVEIICRVRPDLVILDIVLPGFDGFEVFSRASKSVHHLKALAVSGRCDAEVVRKSRAGGLAGYIDKSAGAVGALREALAKVACGENYFSDTFAGMNIHINHMRSQTGRMLTAMEAKVLQFIAKGLTDYEIGSELMISELTARTHRRNIMRKLNVGGTPKLIVFARDNGLID